MSYPVKLTLFKNNRFLRDLIAESEDDFRCAIEMDTGTGWLDATELYQKLLDKQKPVTAIYKVCNSFEKWGAMQQEVVMIKVKMEPLKDNPPINIQGNDPDTSYSLEGFLSRTSHAGLNRNNRSMTIIWILIGMVLSAVSLAAWAAQSAECSQLRAQEGESGHFPPYQVELKIFDCAGMTQDIEKLDTLDRDIMIMRTKNYSLKKLSGQLTKTDPPRKYSEVTSAVRLAKLKKLVDAYYRARPLK